MKEKLLVSVIGGSGLKKKKTWIFVKFQLHSDKYKTKYVNGGDNIKFQKETFIFEVNEDVYPAGILDLTVKTWEMLSSGESFAFGSVPLSPICKEIRDTGYTSSNALQKKVFLKGKEKIKVVTSSQDDNSSINGDDMSASSSWLILSFELVPEVDSTTMKSIPLLFRWFPELPHTEMIISEFYCNKQAGSAVGLSHSGTMYISQNYICFRSPSHLAKNKKFLIPFKEIISIKKKIGSFYLPNAIQIRTASKKYVFASFIHRKKAYKVMTSQWSLLGGHNDMDLKEEDDDQDEEDDKDDVDDDEVIKINQKNHLGLTTSIMKPLSPTTKSNSFDLKNNNNNSNSNNQTNNSNNSSSSTQTQSNQIQLMIDIDNFEKLGLTFNLYQLNQIDPDKTTIQEILEKIKGKIPSGSSSLMEGYQLFKSKNKKTKGHANRSSRNLLNFMLPSHEYQYIHTNSIDLHHRNPKSSSSMIEKKFYPLEESKLLNCYLSSTQQENILYFKKWEPIQDIQVQFEVYADDESQRDNLSKSISLLVNVIAPIEQLFKEISRFFTSTTKRLTLTSSDYYFYQPKNSERGIILDNQKSLRDYKITHSNVTIQVKRFPTFKTFSEKFKVDDKKRAGSALWENYLFLELVQSCFHNPLPWMKMSFQNTQLLLDKLQELCKVDYVDMKTISQNLHLQSAYKDESILVELKSKLQNLESDFYYQEQNFFTSLEYQQWRQHQQHNIIHLMRSIIFKPDGFTSAIFIEIKELEIKPLGNGKPLNPYIILSYNNGEKSIKTSTFHNHTGDEPLYIGEYFRLINTKARGKLLEIIVMNSTSNSGLNDQILDKIELPMKEFENSEKQEKYFHLPNSLDGKLLLSIQLQYQYQEYNHYILQVRDGQLDLENEDPNSPFKDPVFRQVNQVENFKKLFKFLLENQDQQFLRELDQQDEDDDNDDQEVSEANSQVNDKQWINNSSRILLNQYSARFCISKSTWLICQLELMVNHFDLKSGFISEMEELLQQVLSIYKTNNNNNIKISSNMDSLVLVKQEVESLLQCLDKLSIKIKSVIGNYYESFPNNKPRNMLKSLVQSYRLILEIQRFNQINHGDFESILVECIKSESKKKFDDNLQAMGIMALTLEEKVLNVKQITTMLIELVQIIQKEINGTMVYEPAFPKQVKITCEVIESWGNCIASLIQDYCSWAPYEYQLTLDLLKTLLDYYNFTKGLAGDRFKPLPLNQLFVTYVYKLLKEIKTNLHRTSEESLKKDDKRTVVSITNSYSSSYVEFTQACDQSLKDFESLLWLPDSFSYVQLLEVMSSEVIYFLRKTVEEIQHFISHTEIEESDDKPTIFTLNVEPCILMTNIEFTKIKFDQITAKIQKSLNHNLQNSSKEDINETAKQCVETSFQMCLTDSNKTITDLIEETDQFIISRINDFIFYQFYNQLFQPELSAKNIHHIEVDDEETSLTATEPTANDTSDQIKTSLASSSSSSRSISPQKEINSNQQYLQYVKTILTPIKEFLSPKIEEIYGKRKETSFKLFIKKAWIELMSDLRFLFIYPPSPSPTPNTFNGNHSLPTTVSTIPKKSYRSSKKILLNDDQFSIFKLALKELMNIYHRNGSGCATPILEEKYQPLKQLLTLSELDTTSLIDYHNGRKSSTGMRTSNFQPSKDNLVAILTTRVDFDKEARKFINKLNGVVEQVPATSSVPAVVLEEIPNVLPSSEFIIDKYHCSHNSQLGLLIISSRYLAFHNILKEVGITLGNKIIIPLGNISEIKKIKVALIFNALQIKTRDQKTYTFSNFFDRDSVYRDITAQMKQVQKNLSKIQVSK
ncbi:hypothetical protein DLAC_06161 [Tieghemostelium lacteum]|uniref:C2 domain-containing protein n=1 Tax=Tieghemostelium lacteum TaxID=361077 RepID=A0A151ZHK4_TIELA|nr:hypothetical protein DLAC_06161 [Tieghemostelium lacteum]|eukprot:KYQ93468.1 hypothetical protein DLAC_06161 [Tieghemostelium lacteum]